MRSKIKKMKILFKTLTILPLKIGFYSIDCLLFIAPMNLLQLLSSFQVTKKNLTIAFPELSKKEILQLSKRSFIETVKSFYETLYCWSRSSEKIIVHTTPNVLLMAFSSHQPEYSSPKLYCWAARATDTWSFRPAWRDMS